MRPLVANKTVRFNVSRSADAWPGRALLNLVQHALVAPASCSAARMWGVAVPAVLTNIFESVFSSSPVGQSGSAEHSLPYTLEGVATSPTGSASHTSSITAVVDPAAQELNNDAGPDASLLKLQSSSSSSETKTGSISETSIIGQLPGDHTEPVGLEKWGRLWKVFMLNPQQAASQLDTRIHLGASPAAPQLLTPEPQDHRPAKQPVLQPNPHSPAASQDVGNQGSHSLSPAIWGQPLARVGAVQQQSPFIRSPSEIRSFPLSFFPTPPIGREIDFKELWFGRQIGEGGFGKVYYGEWRGMRIAIKVLSPDSSTRQKVVEEFRREVTAMNTLPEHDNVVKLIGFCTAPPNLALVTAYCSRGSLYALLHSSEVISWWQVYHMCLGAARGMLHLHRHNVLHRDLKSGNLLVDGDLTVKVADFGLSKVYMDMHTMTGGLGTYQWMAPEVLANQRYSEKADVYSFGVVMWECCARQVPYVGMNGMQAAMAVMNRGLRPDIPPSTPSPLTMLIKNCWAPIPDQRPSFQQIVTQLEDMERSGTARWSSGS